MTMQRGLSCRRFGGVLAGLLTCAAAARGEPVVFARHLALAPDGRTLAFCWAGDIWTVPIDGGTATRLTVNPADESHPVWSRDGRLIAFASDRHGADNVFVMSRDGGDVRRITFGDVDQRPTDWSPDGGAIYFQATMEGQTYREPMIYRVSLEGGQPVRVFDHFAADARLSPDGRRVAFTRGGSAWWRRGYRGSAALDVWVRDMPVMPAAQSAPAGQPAPGGFVRLTRFSGNDRLPRWSGDGRGIYFLSDRGGTVNVWYLEPGAAEDGARQVTRQTGDDVRDFCVSADGRTLLFTHWDKLYRQALPDGAPQELSVAATADSPRKPIELRTFTSNADECEISPDGKEVAFVVRGELFVTRTAENRLTRRVTRSAARDRGVTWSPDGKALFFVSDEHGQEDIFRAVSAEDPPAPLADSLRFRIERVTDDPEPEFAPAIAPDGKSLAFVRGRGMLIVRDLKSGDERTLVDSWNRPTFQWSPDSKWIAYEVEDDEFNPDIWIVPADGSAAAVNVSQHPDADLNPAWSADGQVLAFASKRDGFNTDVYLVFLSRELDEKATVELNEYFEKAGEKVRKRKPPKRAAASGTIRLAGQDAAGRPASRPASKPASRPAEDNGGALAPLLRQARGRLRTLLKSILEEPAAKDEEKKDDADKTDDEKPREKEAKYAYQLDTAWRRIRRVTTLPADQTRFVLAPEGNLVVFSSNHEGTAGLYSVKWNGEDVKQVSTGDASNLHFGLTGERLYYLKGGVPGSITRSGGDAKSYGFSAKLAIDLQREAAQKFDDAARTLGAGFYHPTLKGLDWPALSRKYRALALQVRTTGEFNEVFSMLLGELNGSHLGISGPGGPTVERVGYLGCEFDRGFPGPGLRVAAVLKDSPADRAESRLVPGDVVLKVNGEPVGPDQPLDRALINTVGDRVILEFLPAPDRDERLAAATRPASAPASAATPASSRPSASAPGPRELVIRPVSYGEFADLKYNAWVDDNARYVAEKSGGRVAYAHIRGMSEPSFHVFERDLYAAAHGKQGLIIDVRNNGGGWTADWILAVLMVRPHAYTVPRGGRPGYPQDRLIFYSWTKPATMMCNQYSFSNAEIISHAFKNLKRGPLVGLTTYGGVISTGSYGLIDGATIRMPYRGWYTLPDGVDMENNGAVPDMEIEETPADEEAGRRPQLDAAIEATLRQLQR